LPITSPYSVSNPLDVVPADPVEDVDEHTVDPLEAVRRLLDDARDVPVCIPLKSRCAAKKLRQQARREVRVSSVTVSLLRNVGAQPAPTPPAIPVVRQFDPLLYERFGKLTLTRSPVRAAVGRPAR
jgi:hypothetical protein